MKIDLIIAGVGGQGILSIAAVIARAALNLDLHLKQSEVHGMAQRGGGVQAHLRLSDQAIHSDIIPKGKASVILAVEPLEALRYLPYLAPEGWLISNARPFENIPNYPPVDDVYAAFEKVRQHILFDADALAVEKGVRLAMNMAMLGAASPFLQMPHGALEQAISEQFARKGDEMIQNNLVVFEAGRELAGRLMAKAEVA